MDEGTLIIGAGGHAKVIADILVCQGKKILGFVDDNSALTGQIIFGFPVLGMIQQWPMFEPTGLVIAIGSNAARRAIAEKLEPVASGLWVTAVHPRAVVADSVRIGNGTVVMAGAVINPSVVIGQHTIINTGCSIDHDCDIGDYVHVAPGAHIAGGVKIGSGAFLGIGVNVIPYLKIGDNSVIGAGATVVIDIPPEVTAKGLPARWNL